MDLSEFDEEYGRVFHRVRVRRYLSATEVSGYELMA
jgi:hypothetical protein